jgi:hypothetical protein
MAALLSLVVVETESGAEVRLRDADQGESYPDVYAALDSLLADEEYRAKDGILRDENGNATGRWRWLDATAEEPAPAKDGSQVTRDLIAKMAARLNSGSPVPIDGISSEPHQQLYATGTHADGYGHVGVEVQDRSGRWHLFLYAELCPEAARITATGLVWSGSIGFTSDGRLLQHALTNVPAVEGLRPNNATRHAAHRVFTRSLRVTMPPKNDKPHARGPALDVLAKIAALLGISMDAEKGAETYESPIMDAIYALKGEAKVEAVLDAAAGGAAPAEGTPPAAATGAPDAVRAAKRALPGFADDAEQEAFTSSVLNALRDIFTQPEAAPAAILELLTASSAAFKGALGAAKPPENAGDSAAMSAPVGAETAARAIADVASLRTEVSRLTGEIGKRDMRAALAKRATEAKAALTDAELDELVTDVLATNDDKARERTIVRALKAAQSVPSGDVFAERSAAGGGGHADFRAAWRSLLPEIAKEHPGLPAQHHVALAQRAARDRFPHLADA